MKTLKHYHTRQLFFMRLCINWSNWNDLFVMTMLGAYYFNAGVYKLAGVLLAYLAPIILFSHIGSRITQYVKPHKLIFISCLFSAVFAGTMSITHHFGTLIALLSLRGLMFAMITPAEQIIIKHLSQQQNLRALCSLQSLSSQCIKITAPLTAGICLSILSAHTLFALSCCLLLSASYFAWRLPSTDCATQASPKKSPISPTNRPLMISLVAGTCFFSMAFLFEPQLSLLFKSFAYSSTDYSQVLIFSGIGGLIATILYGKYARSPASWLAISLMSNGIALIALCSLQPIFGSVPIILAQGLFSLTGFTTTMILTSTGQLLQEGSSPTQIANHSARQQTLQGMGILIAPVAGAWISAELSIPATIVIAACGIMICGFYCLHQAHKIPLAAKAKAAPWQSTPD